MISSLLRFNNQCIEAFKFYQSCFGGEIQLLSVGESRAVSFFPKDRHPAILQAMLTCKSFCLMGTDISDKNDLNNQGLIAMSITCASKIEIEELFKNLSKNGIVVHDLGISFLGTLHAELIDRFGINWVLFEKAEK